jgi:hypothetical protein
MQHDIEGPAGVPYHRFGCATPDLGGNLSQGLTIRSGGILLSVEFIFEFDIVVTLLSDRAALALS